MPFAISREPKMLSGPYTENTFLLRDLGPDDSLASEMNHGECDGGMKNGGQDDAFSNGARERGCRPKEKEKISSAIVSGLRSFCESLAKSDSDEKICAKLSGRA
jgi:hypothetical protein